MLISDKTMTGSLGVFSLMCKYPEVPFREGCHNRAVSFRAEQGIRGCPWQCCGIGQRSYLKWHSTLVVVSRVTQQDISKSVKSRVAMTSSILKQNPRRLMKFLPAILRPLEHFPWTSCLISYHKSCILNSCLTRMTKLHLP